MDAARERFRGREPNGVELPTAAARDGRTRSAAAHPEITARLIATGQVVNPGGAAEVAASIEHQRAAVESFAQALGIKPTQ